MSLRTDFINDNFKEIINKYKEHSMKSKQINVSFEKYWKILNTYGEEHYITHIFSKIYHDNKSVIFLKTDENNFLFRIIDFDEKLEWFILEDLRFEKAVLYNFKSGIRHSPLLKLKNTQFPIYGISMLNNFEEGFEYLI